MTSPCYVPSVIVLPTGWRPMCCHSYFCSLDVLHCNARRIFHRVWYCVLSLRYVRAMHVFDIRALSSSPRLPLCQILFLLLSPLLR